MTMRRELPQRRRCETFEIEYGGFKKTHTVSVGYYPDGAPGEVFISGGKSGEQVEAIARDGAVLISMSLQHGAALNTIKHAVTRNAQGEPSSIIGAVIDRMAE